MATEKIYENKIKKFLEDKGCWYVKFFANAYTKSGIPDLLVSCNGYFLGVEVKAPHGKPSVLQIHNLHKIDESGGFGILLYPKDFELFKNFVDCLIAGDVEIALENYKVLKGRWSS